MKHRNFLPAYSAVSAQPALIDLATSTASMSHAQGPRTALTWALSSARALSFSLLHVSNGSPEQNV
jgi:hypothetical protein